MGSGVLDAAAASETAIMKDSVDLCKAETTLFSSFQLHGRLALGALRWRVSELVAGIGFEPMTFGL